MNVLFMLLYASMRGDTNDDVTQCIITFADIPIVQIFDLTCFR